MDLEARDAGERAGGRADLGREVGSVARSLPNTRGRVGEAAAGELHAVAGVAGEAHDDPLALLDLHVAVRGLRIIGDRGELRCGHVVGWLVRGRKAEGYAVVAATTYASNIGGSSSEAAHSGLWEAHIQRWSSAISASFGARSSALIRASSRRAAVRSAIGSARASATGRRLRV